jgi:aspartate racemase
MVGMKKIGIVGGVAWPSTVDYYTEICRRSEQWYSARNMQASSFAPEMSIESLSLSKALSYIGVDGDEQSWQRFDEYHRASLQRLQASGCEFAAIASNTPHHRFDDIVRGIEIPVIDIFKSVAEEAARAQVSEALILGTPLTMQSRRFQEEFEKHGIRADGPRDEVSRAMTSALIKDLQMGKEEGAEERLMQIVKMASDRQLSVQPAVCLACTELPLALHNKKNLASFEYEDFIYINSTAAHINAIFDFATMPENELPTAISQSCNVREVIL